MRRLTILILALLACRVCAFPDASPLLGFVTAPAGTPISPVAHYPLDGNALDVSGNDNHGTVVGTFTSTNGVIGTAYYSPGEAVSFADYITADGIASLFDGSKAYTISAWGFVPSFTGETTFALFRAAPDRTVLRGVTIQIFAADSTSYAGTQGRAAFMLRNNDAILVVKSSSTVLGRWAHIAAVLDPVAGSATIFIDGQSENQGTPVTPSAPATAQILGDRIGGSRLASPVIVDDARIYDRVLSAANIARIMEGKDAIEELQ